MLSAPMFYIFPAVVAAAAWLARASRRQKPVAGLALFLLLNATALYVTWNGLGVAAPAEAVHNSQEHLLPSADSYQGDTDDLVDLNNPVTVKSRAAAIGHSLPTAQPTAFQGLSLAGATGDSFMGFGGMMKKAFSIIAPMSRSTDRRDLEANSIDDADPSISIPLTSLSDEPISRVPTSNIPDEPISRVPTPNIPDEPISRVPTPNIPDEPISRVHTPNIPDEPISRVPTPNIPDEPISRVPTPNIPNEPISRVPTPNIPDEPISRVPTPNIPDEPISRVPTPNIPDEPISRVPTPNIPDEPISRVPTPNIPDEPISRVPTPNSRDEPISRVPTPNIPDEPISRVHFEDNATAIINRSVSGLRSGQLHWAFVLETWAFAPLLLPNGGNSTLLPKPSFPEAAFAEYARSVVVAVDTALRHGRVKPLCYVLDHDIAGLHEPIHTSQDETTRNSSNSLDVLPLPVRRLLLWLRSRSVPVLRLRPSWLHTPNDHMDLSHAGGNGLSRLAELPLVRAASFLGVESSALAECLHGAPWAAGAPGLTRLRQDIHNSGSSDYHSNSSSSHISSRSNNDTSSNLDAGFAWAARERLWWRVAERLLPMEIPSASSSHGKNRENNLGVYGESHLSAMNGRKEDNFDGAIGNSDDDQYILYSAPHVLFRQGHDALAVSPQLFGALPPLMTYGRDLPDHSLNNNPSLRAQMKQSMLGLGSHMGEGPNGATGLQQGGKPLDLIASPGAPRLLNVAALREAHSGFVDFVFDNPDKKANTTAAGAFNSSNATNEDNYAIPSTLASQHFRRLHAAGVHNRQQNSTIDLLFLRAETAARAWALAGMSDANGLGDKQPVKKISEARLNTAPQVPIPWRGLEGAYSAYFQGLLTPVQSAHFAQRPHRPFTPSTRIVAFTPFLPPRLYQCYRTHGKIVPPYGHAWRTSSQQQQSLNILATTSSLSKKDAGNVLEKCLNLDRSAPFRMNVKADSSRTQSENAKSGNEEEQRGRRRLLKKRLTEEERAIEEAEEIDQELLLNGDGSPMALFLKDKAGLGGRGFEKGLAALGYRDESQLFAASVTDLSDKALTDSSVGMSKVDLRRFRRAVNEAMKADADAVAAAQAAAAEAERIQAAEVAAAAETAAKAAAAAAKEAKEGPPKWKLQAMPPQEMLKEVLTWRFPPNPEEADPVSGEPGPHACTYLELIAAIKVATGKAWLTAYKPNHGGLVEFLKKHPELFLWDGEKQRIELVTPGRAVNIDNSKPLTESLSLPVSDATVKKKPSIESSNDDGNSEEEVFTKRILPSGDATSSEVTSVGSDHDADAIGAVFGWASPQVQSLDESSNEKVNQGVLDTSAAQTDRAEDEREMKEIEKETGQDDGSQADGANGGTRDNGIGVNCEGSSCVGLKAMDSTTLAALSEDNTWDAPFTSSIASSDKSSPKRSGSSTTKIGLSSGGRVEMKVCDRYMAEFTAAEDVVGMRSLLPWLLYGHERTPTIANTTTIIQSSVAPTSYERLFGLHCGACEESPMAGSGSPLSEHHPGLNGANIAAKSNVPTSGLINSALQTSSRVFDRLKLEKDNLLAAFESQLDAAVIQPDFAASETDTGSWKQHGGKKKGRDTSGQWQLKKAAAAAAGGANTFMGSSANSGSSGTAVGSTPSSTSALNAKELSSTSSSSSSKWAQAHADASTAISAAVQTSKVAKLVEWPEAEVKSLKQSAAQVTLPSLWREVRKVNGTAAGAEADATAAAKAGSASYDASSSAAFRLARGARVAVVSSESGGGASLLTYLLGQDKNCLGLPKMNAPWASSSSLVSNVVPAPFELKPRLASTNVYIAVGLHPPSKHVHDKQELEDKDALFGACLKAARAALASMTTTFKPHASVLVIRHPAYLLQAAVRRGISAGEGSNLIASSLEALFVGRNKLGFAATFLHEEVIGLLPCSLRRKLSLLGLSLSEVRQMLSFPYDAAALRKRNGYNSLSSYCKRPAGGDSFSGQVAHNCAAPPSLGGAGGSSSSLASSPKRAFKLSPAALGDGHYPSPAHWASASSFAPILLDFYDRTLPRLRRTPISALQEASFDESNAQDDAQEGVVGEEERHVALADMSAVAAAARREGVPLPPPTVPTDKTSSVPFGLQYPFEVLKSVASAAGAAPLPSESSFEHSSATDSPPMAFQPCRRLLVLGLPGPGGADALALLLAHALPNAVPFLTSNAYSTSYATSRVELPSPQDLRCNGQRSSTARQSSSANIVGVRVRVRVRVRVTARQSSSANIVVHAAPLSDLPGLEGLALTRAAIDAAIAAVQPHAVVLVVRRPQTLCLRLPAIVQPSLTAADMAGSASSSSTERQQRKLLQHKWRENKQSQLRGMSTGNNQPLAQAASLHQESAPERAVRTANASASLVVSLDALLGLASEGRPGSFVDAVVAFEDLANLAVFDDDGTASPNVVLGPWAKAQAANRAEGACLGVGHRITSALGLPSNLAAQICATTTSNSPSSSSFEENGNESLSTRDSSWKNALSALGTRASNLPEHWREVLLPKESYSNRSSSSSKWRAASVAVAAEAQAHRSIGGKTKKGGRSNNSSLATEPSMETTSACAQLPPTPALTGWYNKWDMERSKRAVKSGSASGGRAKGSGKVVPNNPQALQTNKQQSPTQQQQPSSSKSPTGDGDASNDDAAESYDNLYEKGDNEG